MYFSLTFSLAALLSLFFLPQSTFAKPETTSKLSAKIYIDPGHGGKDPGAYINGIKESDVALDVSKMVRKKLEDLGHITMLSREKKDTTVPLSERVEKAVKWNADLVISIHVNSSPHKKVRGAEFFIDTPFKPNVEDYEMLESSEFSKKAPLRWQFFSKKIKDSKDQNAKTALSTIRKIEQFEKSHLLAETLSKRWKRHKLPSGKEKNLLFTSPLFMLKHSPIPTVLVELGYLTHSVEVEMLMSNEERQKMAEKIVKGLSDYIDKVSTR